MHSIYGRNKPAKPLGVERARVQNGVSGDKNNDGPDSILGGGRK